MTHVFRPNDYRLVINELAFNTTVLSVSKNVNYDTLQASADRLVHWRRLNDIALRVHTSELRNVTCHMGSSSVTCHPTQVNAPRLTPARKAGTRLTNPGSMES